MSDEEFGELTPLLFDALLKRKRQQDKRDLMRTGVLAATIVNTSMAAPDKKLAPADFFPILKDDDEPMDLTKMSPEAQAAYIKGMFRKAVYRRKS